MARDRFENTITVHTKSDSHGRQQFTVDWWDAFYHLGPTMRGQVYNTSLAGFIERSAANGFKFKIVDETKLA